MGGPAVQLTSPLYSGRVSSTTTIHQLPPLRSNQRSLPRRARSDPPMEKLSPYLLLLFFAAAAHAAAAGVTEVASSDPEDKCVYTVYVRTGSIWKGGTDSTIGVTLLGSDGSGIRIADLAKWGGLMGAGYDYYERGNLDIFSGRGPCMRYAPCAMNLTSDGTGPHHGWYCNYLEVTTTGPHLGCAQQLFTVEQWLATDASPYRLYAAVDNCAKKKNSSPPTGDAAAAAIAM